MQIDMRIQKMQEELRRNKHRIPQPMLHQPQKEIDLFREIIIKMVKIFAYIFPECKEITGIYVFNKEESERVGCEAQCNRFENGIVTIGICESVFKDVELLKYVTIHEIAHLRTWKHNEKFYTILDFLIAIYNDRTGESLCFQEEWECR